MTVHHTKWVGRPRKLSLPVSLFYAARIRWKRFLSHHHLIISFCRDCGRDVMDYRAPSWAWSRVAHEFDLLCYDCFAKRCARSGIDPVWDLSRGHT